ncbi:uncharacterized protein LOC132937105 [Metopolophium dirhodum]|uniref:uncharacterized protein LOC132937105 n=1 Tax=Metopolophium dirhodum TaxID=44670 RepID=UPI0029902229|nr:uncharacterized protein LOC132937105 [Metopolophium dirhodum]
MRNVQCIYEQIISQLVNDLENIKYVCLRADCWSIFHRSYLGFTVHWIDPQTLHRHSKGLACRRMIGRHIYDNIAEAIDKIRHMFNAYLVLEGNYMIKGEDLCVIKILRCLFC